MDAGGMTEMKKRFGYALLALSVAAWAGIAGLSLLEMPLSAAAAWTTALLIGGEISFLAGVALLGEEAWDKIKSRFKSHRP